ncbi:MAG: AbrB/MazE/SpoVT family DNA-binding domain-containing protein [Oscillospiraceae bacterium]|nr:AbrB/MazE/SpoVT family DNA-binding domain-containing protein [Oscillospiraceae bacterium]
MALARVVKWGNSQGIRIPQNVLRAAGVGVEDNVTITVENGVILVSPTGKKSLDWYLEGYEGENERYDWGETDAPKGRELL